MRALPRKQAKAITALLNHRTVGEAAEAVGVGQSTLFRWMQDRNFQGAYRDAKHRIVQHSISRLQKISGEAVEALREIMTDGQKPPNARVACAKAILDMSIKAIELENLEVRVKSLEENILN
jgi:DNA-binding MurR/RpiR family transcriptional regulator